MRNQTNAMRDVNRFLDAYLLIQKKLDFVSPYMDSGRYCDFINIWAENRMLKGRQLYAARSANVKTEAEFIARYRTDIDESMQIIFNEKIYHIEGIAPLDNTKHYIIIKCYEVKHDGLG